MTTRTGDTVSPQLDRKKINNSRRKLRPFEFAAKYGSTRYESTFRERADEYFDDPSDAKVALDRWRALNDAEGVLAEPEGFQALA